MKPGWGARLFCVRLNSLIELLPKSELNPSADEVEMIAAAQKGFKQVCLNIFEKEINKVEASHLDYTYTYFKKKRHLGVRRKEITQY